MSTHKINVYWLTGSSFIDVDIPIISKLQGDYNIHWVIFRQKESWYGVDDCLQLIRNNECSGEVLSLASRMSSWKSFID